MTTKLFFILTIFAVATSCNNVRQNEQTSQLDRDATIQHSLTNDSSDKFEINCDSVYKDKGITLKLVPINSTTNNEHQYKFTFIVFKQQNGQHSEIFRDTVESTVQEIKFADFNNDKIKDILIQNTSDVRSNWTYNLYMVDKNMYSIRKIKGFEEIKNPNYLPEYDLIDNMVKSERNWTSFYKIVGDTIKDFNIVIYDREDENWKFTYKADYKKAIKKILMNEKNSL